MGSQANLIINQLTLVTTVEDPKLIKQATEIQSNRRLQDLAIKQVD